jgi:hypothetical protein
VLSSPPVGIRMTDHDAEIRDILRQAQHLAVQYFKLTGRPLGVTGEVAERVAAECLNLRPAGVREIEQAN